jgi:hypothetical protein
MPCFRTVEAAPLTHAPLRRHRALREDEAHHHHPPRLPALHQEVPAVRSWAICGVCHTCARSLTRPAPSRSYEKRHKNVPAHLSPCFRVKEGDKVVVGQCRPLSKTVRFNVLKVMPMGSKLGASAAKGGKSFAAF